MAVENAPKRKRRRWLRILAWTAVAVFLVASTTYLIVDHIFNVGSNLVYLANRNSEEPLLIRGGGGGVDRL